MNLFVLAVVVGANVRFSVWLARAGVGPQDAIPILTAFGIGCGAIFHFFRVFG